MKYKILPLFLILIFWPFVKYISVLAKPQIKQTVCFGFSCPEIGVLRGRALCQSSLPIEHKIFKFQTRNPCFLRACLARLHSRAKIQDEGLYAASLGSDLREQDGELRKRRNRERGSQFNCNSIQFQVWSQLGRCQGSG